MTSSPKWTRLRDGEFYAALGHYSPFLVPVVVALAVADDATRWTVGALDWAQSVMSFAWLTLIMLDVRYHQARLCERCALSSPLDPAAEVSRWRLVLRYHHAERLKRFLLAAALALMIFEVTARHWRNSWWACGADAAVILMIGTLCAADWKHRKLDPWCPWCRWDKGGEAEISPDVPAPAASR
jgi:hypothetical protein